MSIKINIYKFNKNEECLIETIEQDLNVKMIDFKNQLLSKYFPDNNYLEINNITERIYKDYGMLFFDKGILPNTNDNYMLNRFTKGNRTFSFLINGKTVEKKNNENNEKKTPFTNFNKYKPKNPDEPEPFILKDEDFPSLC